MADDLIADRYRRRARLGQGGMGEVWLCDDLVLGRSVAVKRLIPSGPSAPDAHSVERMLREARLAAQIHHPNAVAVFDLFIDAGQPYVVMEYVAGETLDERIRRVGARPGPMAAKAIGEVALALDVAHRNGIVHRDIKPANILIDAHEVAKLADFGIARAGTDVTLTRTGQTIGTLSYLAPEVMAGAPATPASDIWSLGATLYACTEGRVPHGSGAPDDAFGLIARRMNEPIAPPRNAGPVTPLLTRMLSSRPEERPTAGEVARVLASVAGSAAPDPAAATTRLEPSPAPPGLPPGWESAPTQTAGPLDDDPAENGRRIWPATYVVVGVAVAAVIALVTYLLVKPSGDSNSASGGPSGSTPPSPTSGQTVQFEGVTVRNATDLAHRPDVTSAGGPESTIVHYRDVVVGQGAAAVNTGSVTTHYVGLLYQAGTVFDETWPRSEPATFRLDQVIPGFVQGVAGDPGIKIPAMKVGGRRILIIPPSAAYGSGGSDGIPPNAAIVYVIDLLSATAT